MQLDLRGLVEAHKFLCVGSAKKAMAKIADPARAQNVTVAEAETALGAGGFLSAGGKGSHRVWRHPDGRKVVLACHGSKLPSYIVRQIRDILAL